MRLLLDSKLNSKSLTFNQSNSFWKFLKSFLWSSNTKFSCNVWLHSCLPNRKYWFIHIHRLKPVHLGILLNFSNWIWATFQTAFQLFGCKFPAMQTLVSHLLLKFQSHFRFCIKVPSLSVAPSYSLWVTIPTATANRIDSFAAQTLACNPKPVIN